MFFAVGNREFCNSSSEVESLPIAFGQLGVAVFERADSQLAREMRSRVRSLAGDERGGQGGRETDALEGVPLLKCGAGCHGCVPPLGERHGCVPPLGEQVDGRNDESLGRPGCQLPPA